MYEGACCHSGFDFHGKPWLAGRGSAYSCSGSAQATWLRANFRFGFDSVDPVVPPSWEPCVVHCEGAGYRCGSVPTDDRSLHRAGGFRYGSEAVVGLAVGPSCPDGVCCRCGFAQTDDRMVHRSGVTCLDERLHADGSCSDFGEREADAGGFCWGSWLAVVALPEYGTGLAVRVAALALAAVMTDPLVFP